MARGVLLCCLLALGTLGAAPAGSPAQPAKSEEEAALAGSSVISERFSRTLSHGEQTLRQMRELRDSLPRSEDLQKEKERFSGLLEAAKKDARVLKDLANQYRGLLDSVRSKSAMRAWGLYSSSMVDGKKDRAPAFVGRAMDYEMEVFRFLRVEAKFSQDVSDEERDFGPALGSEQNDRVEGRFIAQAVACAALVIVSGLATLGWLILRRRRGLAGFGPGEAPVGFPATPARAPGAILLPAPGMPAVLDGHFKVLGMIGKGGMGEVYEAEDVELLRKVAIKRMREELLTSPRDLAQFLNEARLVASMRHPNVVSIYSIVREGGKVYLVFEYVPGCTLRRTLAARERLTVGQAFYVLRCMAAAVDYAHSRKVVHRDLKPENVMITPDHAVRVMDFGIAYQAKATIARLTHQDPLGTPLYMSPEQELGSVSPGVDIYALAVCAYEMIAGVRPFSGPDMLAQKTKGLSIPPSRLAAGLPQAVDGVFRKALDPEPCLRYGSGEELCQALRAAAGPAAGA